MIRKKRKKGQAELGAFLRDEALKKISGKYSDWIRDSIETSQKIMIKKKEFTTDDLWEQLEEVPEPRAMGALMTTAKKIGLCRPTDRTKPSTRPDCHRRPIRIWKAIR